ncbi:Hypothetical protein UVM_LOCUS492 [uncultured virus]|nr:Hypothetical protein UVM_LOCUS492 [uncultured virus]
MVAQDPRSPCLRLKERIPELWDELSTPDGSAIDPWRVANACEAWDLECYDGSLSPLTNCARIMKVYHEAQMRERVEVRHVPTFANRPDNLNMFDDFAQDIVTWFLMSPVGGVRRYVVFRQGDWIVFYVVTTDQNGRELRRTYHPFRVSLRNLQIDQDREALTFALPLFDPAGHDLTLSGQISTQTVQAPTLSEQPPGKERIQMIDRYQSELERMFYDHGDIIDRNGNYSLATLRRFAEENGLPVVLFFSSALNIAQ